MNSKSTVSIKFLPSNRIVDASHDETLLEAGLRAGIPIPHSCGGHGTCGTCRAWVLDGIEHLPERNEIEMEMAEERNFQEKERLCCQNYPVSGLVLQIPEESFLLKDE